MNPDCELTAYTFFILATLILGGTLVLPVDGRSTSKSTDPVKRFLGENREHSVSYDEIYAGGPAVDGIPALDSPRMVSTGEMDQLRTKDRLIVVTRGEVTAGYPIRILNWHELVNDVVGETSVLVTWCPLCGSGMVFDRRVDGTTYSFGVSGLLYQNDVLFYDRSTDSLWSQLRAEAIVGPQTGATLNRVPHDMMTWSNFQKTYPNGRVLSFRTGYNRNYDRDPYARYRKNPDIMFPVNNKDDRLGPKTPVVGVKWKDQRLAVPRSLFQTNPMLVDRLGDQWFVLVKYRGGVRVYKVPESMAVRLKENPDLLTKPGWTISPASLTSTNGSQFPRIEHVDSFWFAWVTFYPDTELRRKP